MVTRDAYTKYIGKCEFQRSQGANIEYGIAIGKSSGNIDVIIDKDFKVVEKLWNYNCYINDFQIMGNELYILNCFMQ